MITVILDKLLNFQELIKNEKLILMKLHFKKRLHRKLKIYFN